ncbi:hypothetical protein ACFL23_00610 [Patescibacteria group bacterium]
MLNLDATKEEKKTDNDDKMLGGVLKSDKNEEQNVIQENIIKEDSLKKKKSGAIFGKEKKIVTISDSEIEELTKDVETHVMPSKFIIKEIDDLKRNKKILLILISIFFVFVVITIGVVIIFKLRANGSKPDINVTIENPSDVIDDTNGYIESPNIYVATSTPDIATSTPDIATSTPDIATSTPDIATSTVDIYDSDHDGLTDLEEELFGSDKLNFDSDGDGYLDGLEVINFYNPSAFAPKSLDEAGLVNIYNESRYNILYPYNWETEVVEEGKILFKASNGEFIQLMLSPNLDGFSVKDWYLSQVPNPMDIILDMEEITNSNRMNGLKIDENVVYLNDYNYIYVITYNFALTGQINYPSVFIMMYRSLISKIDTDGDGIADYEEVDIYKTDPKNIDTDRDGHNDGDEILGGYDPLY